jgi:hypothetical protein
MTPESTARVENSLTQITGDTFLMFLCMSHFMFMQSFYCEVFSITYLEQYQYYSVLAGEGVLDPLKNSTSPKNGTKNLNKNNNKK